MQAWKVKAPIIPGKSYKSVNKIARALFHEVERKTKRKAYIRSKYFDKQKVFLSFFWDHLAGKRPRDRTRRLKYFGCALEVIRDSQFDPDVATNPNNKLETFYRFHGQAAENMFVVQIKKDKSEALEFMSVFPK